jgi:hypothetical protein
MLAVYRESYRPSYFWETNNGAEDWAKNTTYPELFFWSGRPHFDFSWNPQYPEWRSRTSNPAGFNAGTFSGWGSMDNQHMGHNHMRYAYELTGDVLLEEWLKYNVSLVYWNYFTDWLGHTEAERAFGRSTKEAVALTQLFTELPESQLLKPRILQKYQFQAAGVSQNFNQFGHIGNNLFDACDPRVNSLYWCPLQQQTGAGPLIVVGWMTGFVQEAINLSPDPDLRYLAAAEEYFRQDGTPKTYWPITNPADHTIGGIGLEWWTPWVRIAMDHPNATGAQFVLQAVKPVLDERIAHGLVNGPYFGLNDSWRLW